MNITIGNSPDIIRKAQFIRNKVFVVEQHIPRELDLDGLDKTSSHVLLTDKDTLVATARLTTQENGCAVMARIAVAKEYRGSGVASKVVRALLSHARKTGVKSIEIHAHEYLRGFYESFGFEYEQDVEIIGEHQLIEMIFQL